EELAGLRLRAAGLAAPVPVLRDVLPAERLPAAGGRHHRVDAAVPGRDAAARPGSRGARAGADMARRLSSRAGPGGPGGGGQTDRAPAAHLARPRARAGILHWMLEERRPEDGGYGGYESYSVGPPPREIAAADAAPQEATSAPGLPRPRGTSAELS